MDEVKKKKKRRNPGEGEGKHQVLIPRCNGEQRQPDLSDEELCYTDGEYGILINLGPKDGIR